MNKRGMIMLVAIVIILALAGYGFYKLKEAWKVEIARECSQDSDCVKVQVGCCSCNMGGEEKCVPLGKKQEYYENLKKCDINNTFCTAHYNCREEKCSCKNGKCY